MGASDTQLGGYRTLEVLDQGRRVDVYFARPEKRNALTFECWDELADCLAALHERPELRLVVLSGRGKAFSAGVDFEAIHRALTEEKTDYPRFVRRWANVAHALERLPCPVIARINGPALGGAFELALACDLRVAAEGAVFGFPQERFGIVPDAGGTGRLTRIAGPAWAKDLILTGRLIDAHEALELGVVTRVVAPEALDAEVEAMAEPILSAPWPYPYFAIKAIEVGAETGPLLSNDFEGVVDQVLLRTDEVWDRVEAFLSRTRRSGE
jgi:enoyl-CoA hydratase/carnithine racemase